MVESSVGPVNTFVAKRDCSPIHRSLPNGLQSKFAGTVDSCLLLPVIWYATLWSLSPNVQGT